MKRESKSIILNKFLSKRNVNQNVTFPIELESHTTPLPLDKLNITVDSVDVGVNERDNSNLYRFINTLNLYASNVLFNWNGDLSYETILSFMEYNIDDQTYTYPQTQFLKEKNGWFYYQDVSSDCEKTYLEPTPNRLLLNPFYPTYEIYLTYPKTINKTPLVFNGVNITDGIAVLEVTNVVIENRTMTVFKCAINHGLSIGDNIRIRSTIFTGYEGDKTIYLLGEGDGTNESNSFILDFNIPIPPLIGKELRFKKIVANVESQYMGRWFRKLDVATTNNYITFPTAFAKNIFLDKIEMVTFEQTFDLSNLTDYLGRPLTEVYTTVIKSQDYNTANGSPFWSRMQSGIDTIFVNTDYDIASINTTNNKHIERDIHANTLEYFGDIIEYNPYSLTEIVLEVAHHRFNSINREDNNFLEGYFYKPHHRNQIREFGGTVFTSSNDSNIPIWASDLGDGVLRWKDILSNSRPTNTIPFMFDCHYIYNNFNLYLRRQDPCGILIQENETIINGKCYTPTQFTIINTQSICE